MMLSSAISAHRSGDLDSAYKLYQKILLADPKSVDATHLLGVVYYQLGAFKEATVQIEKAVDLCPYRTDLYLNLGNAQRALGLRNDARFSYKEAARLDPHNHEAFYNLGLLERLEGNLSVARRCFERTIEIRGCFVPALLKLGDIFFEGKDNDSAIEFYRRATQCDPRNEEAWIKRGNAEQRKREPLQALNSYDRALALNPSSINGRALKGKLLVDLGEFEEAIPCLKGALLDGPSRADIATNLAIAEEQVGASSEAMTHYAQALSVMPNSSDIQFNYGYYLLTHGLIKEACVHLESASKSAPASIRKFVALGVAQKQLKKYAAASLAFERAIEIKAIGREDYWMQSLALLNLRMWTKAFDSCTDPRSLPFVEHDTVFSACRDQIKLPSPLEFHRLTEKRSASTVLVSGNSQYLIDFLPKLASTLNSLNQEVDLHVHLMLDQYEDFDISLFRLNPVSSFSVDRYKPTTVAGYTTRRYVRLIEILSYLERPVLLTDIDSEFAKDPASIFNNYAADVTLFHRQSELYINQQFAAGMTLCRPTQGGLYFADAIRNYLLELEYRFDALSWYSDQMALLATQVWIERQQIPISIAVFDSWVMGWTKRSDACVISYKGKRKQSLTRR